MTHAPTGAIRVAAVPDLPPEPGPLGIARDRDGLAWQRVDDGPIATVHYADRWRRVPDGGHPAVPVGPLSWPVLVVTRGDLDVVSEGLTGPGRPR